ncbi:MAG: hypothetical protein WAL93_09850 [Desulfobacterales bacterium]
MPNPGIIQHISSIARAEPDDWRYNIEVNLHPQNSVVNISITMIRVLPGLL